MEKNKKLRLLWVIAITNLLAILGMAVFMVQNMSRPAVAESGGLKEAAEVTAIDLKTEESLGGGESQAMALVIAMSDEGFDVRGFSVSAG